MGRSTSSWSSLEGEVVPVRYVLVEDDGDLRIPCAAADGVFTGPAGEPLRLLGCAPPEDVLSRLRAGRRLRPVLCSLAVVDCFGLETALSLVSFDVTEWVPSALGAGLVDLRLPPLHDPPGPAGRTVWDLWSTGRPPVPNLWAGHDRTEWLRAALAHPAAGPDRPPHREYRLDGTYVTDAGSFSCALGEAINGPGGYFGWNLDALADCLRGGFGATVPFTLVSSVPGPAETIDVLETGGVTIRAAPGPPASPRPAPPS